MIVAIEGLFVVWFEKFFSKKEGSWCIPEPCDQGYFVPIGWEEELQIRGISYELRNDLTRNQNFE